MNYKLRYNGCWTPPSYQIAQRVSQLGFEGELQDTKYGD